MAEDQRPVSSHSGRFSQERAGTADPAGSSGDPLTELARLMGRDHGVSRPARNEAAEPPASGEVPEIPDWLSRPVKSGSDLERGRAVAAPVLNSEWRARFADLESALGRSLGRSTGPDGLNAHAAPEKAILHGSDEPQSEPNPGADQPTGQHVRDSGEASDPYRTAEFDGRYDSDRDSRVERADNPYYAEGGSPPSSSHASAAQHDESAYDHPALDRHWILPRAVLAVVGLAVVGSVAAYGYRSLTGHAPTDPPIIKANTEPAKIMANPQGGDSQSAKQPISPHGPAQTETIVPRQEEPVPVPTSSPGSLATASADTAATAPAAASPPVSSVTVAPAVAPTTLVGGTPTNGDPKKVRTVTIRPDQPPSLGMAMPPDTGASVVPAWPAAGGTTSAASPAWPAPPAAAGSGAPEPHPPTHPTHKTGSPASDPTVTATQSHASIQSQASTTAGRSAAAPAARPAAAPTRTAAAEAGHYAVQLSSQRSDADARASFRALQQKYPSVLGSRELLVRRKDLGAKGIYYRAEVGPFPSLEEANRMCGALKAAGGQCIVQHD